MPSAFQKPGLGQKDAEQGASQEDRDGSAQKPVSSQIGAGVSLDDFQGEVIGNFGLNRSKVGGMGRSRGSKRKVGDVLGKEEAAEAEQEDLSGPRKHARPPCPDWQPVGCGMDSQPGRGRALDPQSRSSTATPLE